ncbi:hypothetical protein OESDEN_14657 [Oesophagostomum dentatum]|uniref:Uncharacterized protein n=1 Tax=Oesophagostomum dentatum TaxID=61180 RepID=A0A0B1SQ47_OESDE|nr:hypothetical protein OESDEN_14657 [Oesophagostomum dentatum]
MRKFSESNPVKGYIIMEYVENVKVINVYENVPLKAVREVLRAMAVMQAMSLKLSPAEKEQFPKNFFAEFYGQFFNDEKLELTAKSLRASVDERLENKIRKVERYLKPLMDLP